ncbi:MAG: DNA internalization-related competence protein ComEC/Rec2 [Firmicutes bacterium]|nr:DNA internalization-related competence protein ComEC/Rec2 [Bacillota bacterium]
MVNMRIRRPLYFIAAAFTAAILIRFYFGLAAAAGAGIGLAMIWLVRSGAARRPDRNPRIVITLILIAYSVSLLSCWICDRRLAADPLIGMANQKITAVGVVREPEIYTDSRGNLMLRIDTQVREVGGSEIPPSRLLLTVPAEAAAGQGIKSGDSRSGDVESEVTEAAAGDPSAICRAMSAAPPGCVIRFTGTVQQPDPKRNPNCFDYRLYLKTKGIQTTLRGEGIQVLGLSLRAAGRPGLGGRLFLMREHALERIGVRGGAETESLLRAILFGEKGMLDEEIQNVFQRNGTAHVLAVSGLHVGMIYGALTAVWNLLSGWFPFIFGLRKGKRFFICTAVFFMGYAFLAGFSPSVVRAVCMVLLHAFASMTGRRYDLSCAAFAVGIGALLRNPYLLFQSGFQMSFLAILTLGLIAPYIHRVYSGALAGSIAIQIGLGPYMACQFNVLPLLAVFINIPVIFLTGILVPAGLASMMLPDALPILPGLLNKALSSLCTGLVRMNELCGAGRFTSVTCASPPRSLLATYYLGLLVFASEEGRLLFLRRRKKTLQRLVIGVVIASAVFGQAADDGFTRAQMVFVDVGQGDCMHLRCGGSSFLFDGGGSHDYEVGMKTLRPYLLKNGVRRIDGAFVTHLHTDHYQGICELAKAGMVRRLFLYEGNRLKEEQVCRETGLKPSQLTYLRQGQRVELPGGSAAVLWPRAESEARYRQMIENEEDENASSLILRVEVRGVSLLVTGDLGEEGERELLRKYAPDDGTASGAGLLHVDVLKVGHHGSKTSSSDAFLDAVDPRLAVIQVGKNNLYGHPTPEVLEKLSTRGIPVYRNDRQGAVGLKLKAGRIREVMTMIRPEDES